MADSDGRQETQTIYPLQYVSSNDLPGEMLYSTATTAGNQQDVHRLQYSIHEYCTKYLFCLLLHCLLFYFPFLILHLQHLFWLPTVIVVKLSKAA